MASVSSISVNVPPQCTYVVDNPFRAQRSASVKLLEIGGKLLEKGLPNEAMAVFDASFRSINSHTNDVTADICWAEQQLAKKEGAAVAVTSPPADIYHEDECDVGPRPFSTALSCCESTPSNILQLVICYNQALVYHTNNNYAMAMQLYSVIIRAVNNMTPEQATSTENLYLALRVFNNMGHISYMENSEEIAHAQFEQAIVFAKLVQESSNDHMLAYATVLSNWCRVQWMFGFVSQNVFSALEEVLQIRLSVLGSNHVDVASAHYNLGMAKYSRQAGEAALHHFVYYLSVSSQQIKAGLVPQLDPIYALVFVLLIKNESKDEKPSQDLVWGLRALQDKRNELGPAHPEVASILNFIGTLLFHQQELDHALLFFQEELRLEEDLIDRGENVSVSVTCNNIGRILQELGRFSQAIHYYKRSLKVKFGDINAGCDTAKGKCDDDISSTMGDMDEAQLSPATMNLYSTVWYNLGLIHDKQGAFKDAIKAFQMSLKLRRAMLGHNHADVACLLYNIGVLQMEQQMLSEATYSFREALRIRRVASTGQLNDRHVVKTLQKLSTLHKAKGNLTGSLQACDEVIRVLKASQDFDVAARLKYLGSTLRDVAELHHTRGDLKLALRVAKESAMELRSLRLNYANSLAEQVNAVEQETATLLLIGSLQHEEASPQEAYITFAEAASVLHDSVMSRIPSEAANVCSQVLPLFEVSSMLASAQCAPEA